MMQQPGTSKGEEPWLPKLEGEGERYPRTEGKLEPGGVPAGALARKGRQRPRSHCMQERERRRVSVPSDGLPLPALQPHSGACPGETSWKPETSLQSVASWSSSRVESGWWGDTEPFTPGPGLASFQSQYAQKTQSGQLLLGDPGRVMGRASLTKVSGPPDPGYGVAPSSLPSRTVLSSETLTKLPLLYLSEYAFGTYCVPGMVLGAKGRAMSNTNPASALMELTLQWGRTRQQIRRLQVL